MVLLICPVAWAEDTGSIRGVVQDKDFNAALPLAEVSIAETGQKVVATEEGNYLFAQVASGRYTLVFWKEGYTRLVKGDVVVSSGLMTEVDAQLAGEFSEMEEFIVQDIQMGGDSEAGLLNLRLESPALQDSISSGLMSQAGASDVASALNLVAGASVAEGKYAVVRGLPDRYVNSQMNGVRLPTADADKRAVELDQFPSAVVESVRVSKTFTPDQQGDASGGAVNVILKGIPDAPFLFKMDAGTGINTKVLDHRDDFPTYRGGGVNVWGGDDGGRDLIEGPFPMDDNAAVGASRGDAPMEYDWNLLTGGKHEFEGGLRIGAVLNLFNKRDTSVVDDGIDDKYWVGSIPAGPEPQTDVRADGTYTSLYDIRQGSEEVKWGGLGALGLETEFHSLDFVSMYTRTTEDTATIAENTRGKAYYFPGYDPNDPQGLGNIDDPATGDDERDISPYLRLQTLKYSERTTSTVQLSGRHDLGIGEVGIDNLLTLRNPQLDWIVSHNVAEMYEPDKRLFSTQWKADSYVPPRLFPPIPAHVDPAIYLPYKPAANFTLGNLQRVWKEITETSDQYAINLKLPFRQWTEDDGYLKIGLFNDHVVRHYDQESFSNLNDNSTYEGGWDTPWSDAFPGENHPVSNQSPARVDVDYRGRQDISAWYWMLELPLNSQISLNGGFRHELTELSIKNSPEEESLWYPPGATAGVVLTPGAADVAFEQHDILPAASLTYQPFEQLTLRAAYAETVARQTFRELTPILQQEYLGGDVFIGNPDLQMSALKNYDLRLDYRPYEGSLVSVSYFYKDVRNPIEYVQRAVTFTFTEPVNFPKGYLSGWEFEVRQDLERFWKELEGLSIGANATIIDSEVTLPNSKSTDVGTMLSDIGFPIAARDMVNAPHYLYNLYLMYELERTGTQFGLFYSVRGDTLVAGDGVASFTSYVPAVYETEYGTLNFSIIQKIGEHIKLKFQARNLTDPDIKEVYRSRYFDGDVTKTSYSKGVDLSFGISAEFRF